jgi:hypothetical protein
MPGLRACLVLGSLLSLATCLHAQDAPDLPPPFPAPATKLEAFQPAPGALFTIAHESAGTVVSAKVEVQEIKPATGDPIRGVIVEIAGAQSFLDPDELDGLLHACDSLLEITSNPTQFRDYEAHYLTRGSLELTAAISGNNSTIYRVTTGPFRTQEVSLTASQMRDLREVFATAAEKLAALEN